MLMRAIACERLKCKGTLIWPAFLLIPVIPVILGCGNYLGNLELLKSAWYSLWTQVTLFYANFCFAPLIGIYCAFLWRYERFNTCMDALFARPVSYVSIYLSKYLMVCFVTALTQLWLAVLYVAAGKCVGLPGLPPAAIFLWIARGAVGGFVLATIQFFFASAVRSFAFPIAAGLVGGVSGLIAAGSQLGIFYPYSLMILGMNANRSEDMLSSHTALFLVLSAGYILLFLAAGISIISRREPQK